MKFSIDDRIKIADIRIDGGTQPRAQLDQWTVDEYAEAMTEGAAFPPVTVFQDGSELWLADGFHRVAAAKKIGSLEIAADVRQGTRRDAQWYSFGANKAHGLRRAKGDAKRAIEAILNDREWSKVPQNQIAGHVGVSAQYVSKIVASINQFIDRPSERTVTRNGTTYTQDTSRIGKRPEPEFYEDDEYDDYDPSDDLVDDFVDEEPEEEPAPPRGNGLPPLTAESVCELFMEKLDVYVEGYPTHIIHEAINLLIKALRDRSVALHRESVR